MSQELLPARNVFGEPRETDSLGPDFVSPFWQSKSKDDPVVAEMLRIQKSVSAPGKQFTEGGERIDYPREVYDRYHEVSGRFTYNNLLALIGSQRYANMDDAARRKAAGRAIREARESARAILDSPGYPLPAKGSGPVVDFQEYLADDPFAGFPSAEGGSVGSVSDPWADFPEATGQ